jgi:ATP-dependent RNA helicase RhlB
MYGTFNKDLFRGLPVCGRLWPASYSATQRKGRPQGDELVTTTKKDWSINDFPVPAQEGSTRFHDFPLRIDLMHGIADAGFQYCTPIQAEVLGHTLKEEDAIGRAQTGTGKTAAFLITIINDLLNHPVTVKRYAGEPRALIIAPTRELVMQIEKDAKQLAKHTDLAVMSVVGGMNFNLQQEKLQTSLVDILVATPGRLLDFLNRHDVWLDRVESLVIDEADRMLDMGFIPDVKRIINATPDSRYRQTLLFSATFSQDVMNLAKRWTEKPCIVDIEPEHVTTEQVDQRVYITETSQKFDLLYHLIKQEKLEKVMIFANRRDQTRKLCERLQKKGIHNVAMISGEVPQGKRMKTLERFRSGKLDVLIATDVAGRGIHIDDVSHVINYNLPEDPEDYVHRIGRTGRAGKTGVSISFACEDDAFLLPKLEQAIGMKLECQYPPADIFENTDSADA